VADPAGILLHELRLLRDCLRREGARCRDGEAVTAGEPSAAGAGPASRFATSVVLILLVFTLALVVLAFPAGLYTIFHGGLSPRLGYGSFVATYLWLGPVPEVLPFTVPIGGLFVVLTLVYVGLLLLGLLQPLKPREAVGEAFRTGVSSLLGSPFLVILVSIGFLNFTGVVASALSEAVAGTVGNPFSNVDPLLEMGSLTFAPLREEFGFRVVLIGAVALILSIGRPTKQALKSLWRPSAAYEGLAVGGASSLIIWVATGASAATFGVCHIVCGGGGGWNWSKLPEATWGGVVLGYLYVRYGFHVAVLTHWGVDYLGSVFSFFGQAAYGIPVNSNSSEFVGQYLVDLDMILLFGLASTILVIYVGVKKLEERRSPMTVSIDKGPPSEGVMQP